MSPRTVRADVAEMLFVTPDELDDDENLFNTGLDSVALLTLVERWREQGADVAFVDLAENPTLAGFDRILAAAAPRPAHPPRSSELPQSLEQAQSSEPSELPGPPDA
ncbi:phosphopantetheine-binding protein [Frankia sp. AgPm24]|uniref:phosphopantetheine-binding protein n=1 Tax=Frankia sp. AgPm24 TaxID=631128 RepID=UPI0020101A75|nr:phosphopantetheine-binding protein [Frankia sp. AgPm24]MCK9923357.1 phosphopantetheine-binding protein [Frankia sp. AgPm24]